MLGGGTKMKRPPNKALAITQPFMFINIVQVSEITKFLLKKYFFCYIVILNYI